MLGGDGPQDVIPSLVEGVNLPVHTLFIVSIGVYIFDHMDLEAVADTATRLNRWDPEKDSWARLTGAVQLIFEEGNRS